MSTYLEKAILHVGKGDHPIADLNGIVAAKIYGQEVSLRQMLYALKVGAQLGQFLTTAINEILVSRAAQRLGIGVTAEELQQAADTFRQCAGLEKAADTEQWLKQSQLTVEELEARLERGILWDKVKQKVTEDQVEPFFAANRTAFDQAVLAHLVLEQEGVANELLAQIRDEEANWGDLACKYSVDKATKDSGGQLGLVSRKSLTPAIESAVFAAKPGEVVGPIKTDMGYHLVKVEEIHLGELNEQIASAIRENLLAGWLLDEYKNAGVEVKLHELM